MSKVKLDIEISSAELELDVTLVDRLDSLITAAKFNQPSSLQATKNYTSLYLNRDASHQLIKQVCVLFTNGFVTIVLCHCVTLVTLVTVSLLSLLSLCHS